MSWQHCISDSQRTLLHHVLRTSVSCTGERLSIAGVGMIDEFFDDWYCLLDFVILYSRGWQQPGVSSVVAVVVAVWWQ